MVRKTEETAPCCLFYYTDSKRSRFPPQMESFSCAEVWALFGCWRPFWFLHLLANSDCWVKNIVMCYVADVVWETLAWDGRAKMLCVFFGF